MNGNGTGRATHPEGNTHDPETREEERWDLSTSLNIAAEGMNHLTHSVQAEKHSAGSYNKIHVHRKKVKAEN